MIECLFCCLPWWILFNGKITLEICLFGLVISGAIYLFAIKLLDYDPKKELKALKKLGGIFHFLLVLLRDIIKASFHVIGVILSPKKEVDPKLVFFYTDLSTDTGRVGLANAITLTPARLRCFVSMSCSVCMRWIPPARQMWTSLNLCIC